MDVLVNLSSGLPLDVAVTDQLLSLQQHGKKQHKKFVNSRLTGKTEKFHDPIKRNSIGLFNSLKKKITLKSKKSVEVNRDILAKLLSISMKKCRVIDFDKALTCPLSPVPLSLCNADSSMRKTDKSKLLKKILAMQITQTESTHDRTNTIYILDFMALIRTMSNLPETFEGLASRVIKSVPTGFKRVEIIADCYFENSIKNSERMKRGTSTKILVKSSKSKIPRDFSKFLQSGDNKTRLVELIFQSIQDDRVQVLNSLRTNQLILSGENCCWLLGLSSVQVHDNLVSNHEEADTKVIAHAHHALVNEAGGQVMIRLHSGDTDIVVLVVSLFQSYKERVAIDNGSGNARKTICLCDIAVSPLRASSTIGIHAFSGNDYMSSFFRKGKNICWEIMTKYTKFENCFAELGITVQLSMEIFNVIEEYVCHVYGYKEKSINLVRSKLFYNKEKREHKVTDLSTLPPCQDVLLFHAKRANMIAYIWRNSIHAHIDYPDINEHGWQSNGEIYWMLDAFPHDIEQLLEDERDYDGTDDDDDGDDDDDSSNDLLEYGSEVESDDDEFNELY